MALAPRTVDAYRSDWADFAAWCRASGHPALPATPDVVVAYLDELARTRRSSTLQRRLAAIRAVHLDAGAAPATDAPAVGAAMARARWRQRHRATPTTPIAITDLRAMSRALPDTTSGVRDRAVLLVGYGAALRPSEMVSLAVEHVTVCDVGLRVDLARGGIRVPYGSAPELCAVAAWRAWHAWLAAAGLDHGPAFRAVDRYGQIGASPLREKAVGRIVRRAADAAELDAARYTGLSLRRGMVAAAATNGVSRRMIMRQTGHRSDRLVRHYIDDVDAAR